MLQPEQEDFLFSRIPLAPCNFKTLPKITPEERKGLLRGGPYPPEFRAWANEQREAPEMEDWFTLLALKMEWIPFELGFEPNDEGKFNWQEVCMVLAMKYHPGFRVKPAGVGAPPVRSTELGLGAARELRSIIDAEIEASAKRGIRKSVLAICAKLARKPDLLPQYFHTIGRGRRPASQGTLRDYYNEARKRDALATTGSADEAIGLAVAVGLVAASQSGRR